MGILRSLDVVKGDDQIAASIFEGLFPHFLDVSYSQPSEYVNAYWERYQKTKSGEQRNNVTT